MIRIPRLLLAAAAALPFINSELHAQDSGPLIDKLVQKGILNDQEAEDLRADMVKDFQSSSAGKLNISSPVTELKLYGDGRLRYQYDDQQAQTAGPEHVTQRSRFRYRLRLNADFRLTNNFFGGVQVETGQASDSANETVQPAYGDSGIYINRVFLGLNIGDWATVVAGKQKNPFYTTDLVWDPDISPYGLTESISFDKAFKSEGSAGSPSSYSKDGKTVTSFTGATAGSSWGGFKLSLVAGQLVYETNNNEAAVDGDAKNDGFQFVGQLVASYEVNSKTSVTFAPGFMIYNAADVGGDIQANNETAFTGASGRIDANNDGIADFTQDPVTGAVTVSTGNVSGETRDLAIVTAPGEFKFPIGSLNGRFYWDFAYNTSGHKRYDDVYGFGLLLPSSTGVGTPIATTQQRSFTDQDAMAWLAGLEIGAGKGQGAWTIFANYRETGLAAVDPNLNDSDFALGKLNSRGFKFGTTYGISDAVSIALTGFVTYNLDDNLADQFGLANRNAVNTVQFDVNFKF
ncbi:MAG: putative porin [Chthoniobacterales bacterium]